jgi:anti-anti-sigma factor
VTGELPTPRVPIVPEDLIEVAIQRHDTTLVLARVAGELDMATAGLVGTQLALALDLTAEVLVVDLIGVTFFGSAGLSVLLRLREQCARRQVELRLVALQRVIWPMTIGGVNQLFRIHTTVRGALDPTNVY